MITKTMEELQLCTAHNLSMDHAMFSLFPPQVRVNPDNKVPELSYDNNLVTCDLYYQGSYAKATNCKHVKPES